MLSRILIANRGEIACRIARTCRRLGVEYVAVYSEADAASIHLHGAVKTVCLGPAPATASYLDIRRVVQAAVDTGCDAVHPGYGFLAENAAFARAVLDAGLTFIGPLPDTIEAMGDKAQAKTLMRRAGVPVVPGSEDATEDADQVAAAVQQVGFPALLKPAAGGGGKGMVVLQEGDDIRLAVQGAVRQARASFGDGRLLVERFVQRPRHIEVQVFGDQQGNVVHLFERECSLQRRHQKIIEEAPAINLPDTTRQALRDAAVAGARAIGYQNAGTFEFIVDERGEEFFFLEMNTRLQVEHPVTEMITGLDLVEWQLKVAAGESLPVAQDALRCNGHAIEARVYAEDPLDDFKPAPGRLQYVAWPAETRVDAGVASGSEVPAFYDPIIAKLIVHDKDRASALDKMRAAMADSQLLGVKTNIGFLQALLACPEVVEGKLHTGFVDANLSRIHADVGEDAAVACAAAIQLAQTAKSAGPQSPWMDARAAGVLDRRLLDPRAPLGRFSFRAASGWRDVSAQSWERDTIHLTVDGVEHSVQMAQMGSDHIYQKLCSDPIFGRSVWRGLVNGKDAWVAMVEAEAISLQVAGTGVRLLTQHAAEDMDEEAGTLAVSSMPGVVAAVPVAPGDRVEKGQVVAVVEAMKMENAVAAPMSGIVHEVRCAVGDTVHAGAVLVSFEEA